LKRSEELDMLERLLSRNALDEKAMGSMESRVESELEESNKEMEL